jgi:hypothetical protein
VAAPKMRQQHRMPRSGWSATGISGVFRSGNRHAVTGSWHQAIAARVVREQVRHQERQVAAEAGRQRSAPSNSEQ